VTTTKVQASEERIPLSRERIVEAALRYIDGHGLEAFSMHKLGAELGVKGMSLYNHVANKDDVLDGVVELLWSEVDSAAPSRANWREGFRSFAQAVRDVARRHPNAAPLIITQSVMPAPALRVIQAHITAATDGGRSEGDAYALLRTIAVYALGSTLTEVTWSAGQPGCAPAVSDLLRPGTPADLAAVADIFCGQHDPEVQFVLGLDLMLRGIEDTQPS
jgi:TetR/AcrR family tetracycline transcriptional repressor